MFQAQPGAHQVGVRLLARQVVGLEVMRQMRIAARVPGLVDAVDDAGQPTLGRDPAGQPVQAGAERLGGDLARVGRADRGHVVGVEQAGLEERHPVVELDAVDVESALGNAEQRHAFAVAQTLVGNVVDGQNGRHARALPAQIGRRQAARPVVHVQQVRLPAHAGAACGDLGGGEREAREPQVVVRPVVTLRTGVGAAGALIQRRLENQVQDQPVIGACLADAAGVDAGVARQMGHHGDVVRLGDDLGIGGEQHAHIDVAPAQRSRQSRRHVPNPPALAKSANSLVANRTFMWLRQVRLRLGCAVGLVKAILTD